MRIALLHYSSPPIVGGVESVMRHHARLLQLAGHEVQIIAGRGSQISEGIPFIQIPLFDSTNETIMHMNTALNKGIIPEYFQTFVLELYGKLSSALRNVDVLIAHNVCSLHKNLALTAAIKQLSEDDFRPHIILWHHDLAWKAERYQQDLHPGYPWTLISSSWGNRMTHVAVSEMRKQEWVDLTGISPELVQVIPNGIDVKSFFKLEKNTVQIIETLGLLKADPLFLLPVRITARKNIEAALHIMKHLLIPFPKTRLIITGPPGAHNLHNQAYFQSLLHLREQLHLEQAVHFLAEKIPGHLADEVITDLYRIADALLLPSLEEGFGITLLEAGISHLPIFCSDIPSLQSLGGEMVSYFPPRGNPQRIAEQISTFFYSHPRLRFAARIRADYSWEGVFQNHVVPLLSSLSTEKSI